ncbi:hypothetical protein HOLleu_10824 [Holothuria leucospilota]|uniref:Uncharacterized protein n=1 Tax=Holothuria leucospilota TaxID=206669 RepID=A0A9Q1CDR1_HOLLE|nr:hypothetical protein HOLleu_10824 [Holothuria leucospilota]
MSSSSVGMTPATPCKSSTQKLPKTPVQNASSHLQSSPLVESFNKENKKDDCIIGDEILRRVGSSKSWGALVCNLMTAPVQEGGNGQGMSDRQKSSQDWQVCFAS